MGSSLVVVAIPDSDDYTHKISSEEIPHLTLLYLGEASKVQNLSGILNFVQHASSMFPRFMLDTDRRGVLGDDQADVLFFTERSTKNLGEFRSQLLKDSAISTAYSSVDQFPVWNPHLTLGYPATPAREDDREYGGLDWVSFDRIAVWFGDYEGVEFPLEQQEWETDFAMSDIRIAEKGEAAVNEILHYGKKGMKWGRRMADTATSDVSVAERRTVKGKTKIKTTGGANHPAHPDAIAAKAAGQKIKKSGLDSVSNKELQDFANRVDLEMRVRRLTPDSNLKQAKTFVNEFNKSPEGKLALSAAKKAAKSKRAKTAMAKILTTAVVATSK